MVLENHHREIILTCPSDYKKQAKTAFTVLHLPDGHRDFAKTDTILEQHSCLKI